MQPHCMIEKFSCVTVYLFSCTAGQYVILRHVQTRIRSLQDSLFISLCKEREMSHIVFHNERLMFYHVLILIHVIKSVV